MIFDSDKLNRESMERAPTARKGPGNVRRTLSIGCLLVGWAGLMSADQIQGVVADWNCVKPMVRDGREKTLRDNRGCSMMKNNYQRSAYGLITDDKKFYRFDDSGNPKILQLLKDTPDKDNLKVVVSGDINGNTIKIVTISEL